MSSLDAVQGFCDMAEPVYLPTTPMCMVYVWVLIPLPISFVAGQDCSMGSGTHWPQSNFALQGDEVTNSSLEKLKIASVWAGWVSWLTVPVSIEERDQGNGSSVSWDIP